jgi:GT2 family glycosyltransferase
MKDTQRDKPLAGIVIIGRNEGLRLQKAFESLFRCRSANCDFVCIYVDSGSTDGSVELARSQNITTHCLDATRPFSAARARLEGAAQLIAEYPDLTFIQFLDGDCSLTDSWLDRSVEYLISNENIGVVCGRLEEKESERSLFNRFNALRWKAAPCGVIDTCGGIFLIRRSVYQMVGGFNPLLLTGEEAELCSRIRNQGYQIVRLDAIMAQHDSDLVCFKDWWQRAVWGGYGDALEYKVLNGKVGARRRRETRSVLVWALAVPLFIIIGALGALWFNWLTLLSIIGLLGYLGLIGKVTRYCRKQGDTRYDAVLYAVLLVLRKFPYCFGYWRFKLDSMFTEKRPDPHAG